MTSKNDNETDTESRKPLKLSRPGKLSLKKTVETGQVRQSFSHGRTKAVTVEVKRSRNFERGASGRMREVTQAEQEQEAAEALAASGKLSSLTEGERAARAIALEESRREEELRRQREAEEAARRAEEEVKRKAEEEARRAEEEKRRAEEEARKAEEGETSAAPEEETPIPAAEIPVPAPEKPVRGKLMEDETEESREKRKTAAPPRPSPRRGGEPRRRQGKLTISQALDDGDGRQRSLASVRRQREKMRGTPQKAAHAPPSKVVRDVVVPETISVQDLASRMAERGAEVVKCLMKMGVMATITQSIDADTAELVVEEFGHRVKRVSAADVEIGLRGVEDEETDLQARPPVVTIMGHVDHGKTTLLDALRKTDVAQSEAGGITQHIGAYRVTLESGDKIAFVDTPGHAAFTEMRLRGAKVTDIVILVVAADDGIMEQTKEAINHAKAAEVPIIVAINKMDKPDADPDRVRNDLLQQGLVPEEMGGDILTVEVSALKGTNLDKLLETVLLQAEILELKANADRSAEGAVIEAKMERGRGAVATVLVQRGTLRVGDIFVTGAEWGRVRAMLDDHGEQIEEAGPSTPVEVLGLNGMPVAGDDFVVVENESKARDIAEFRSQTRRNVAQAAASRGTLEQLFTQIKEGEAKRLPVIVKSDVHGSLEAIVGSLDKLGNDEVKMHVLHSAVGGINESDVTLAKSTGAVIIGFNVRANPQAREQARQGGVDIRYYSIIYNLIDDMKALLSGLLAPEASENFLGYAEIREVFNISKTGRVAGCRVTEGLVRRGAKVRLLRDDVVVHDGTLKSLRRFKDEVREVKDGYECGMAFENYNDIQVGDQIECYEIKEVARAL
jgi:translation initiation factor IF-2